MDSDYTMDAHLSALYAERRRIERGDLTEAERQRVIDEVNKRIDSVEHPYHIMKDYGGRWKITVTLPVYQLLQTSKRGPPNGIARHRIRWPGSQGCARGMNKPTCHEAVNA